MPRRRTLFSFHYQRDVWRAWLAVPALLAVAACNGGQDTTTPTPAPSPPSPSFEIACQPSPLVTPRGCATATCTVTSRNAFSGPVSLSCSGQPEGIACAIAPSAPVIPANGSATIGFTVSVDASVPIGTHSFAVVGTGGGSSQSFGLDVNVTGVLGPEVRGRAMTLTGCAGYVEGIPNRSELQHFRSVFVGAWRFRVRGEFCEQTLSEGDGSFQLVIPRCFAEGEMVFLTAGGLETCVRVPYRAGSVARVELFGRQDRCP